MNQSSEIIRNQLEHRTIREFKDEPIQEDIFLELMEVARRTATSTGMQAFSIIRITDKRIREEIALICNQEYVARAPELLIFVADQFRNWNIAKEKGCFEESAKDMDRFFSAFTDACIASQNVVNAAESIGLGTVYLGSILNDSKKICELLKLPELTFPVIGLGIGYPNQNPQLKPRMDMKLRVFENEYNTFYNYLDIIRDYDDEMRTYYDLRDSNRRVDSFSDQVVTRLRNVIPKRQDMIKVIKKQGFTINLWYNITIRIEGDNMDLFTMSMEEKLKKNAPLADRMRPTTIKDFVGQKHLLGEGKFLYRSIKADRITSMILFGPPGIGKTTLAMIIANSTNMRFEKLSAVTSGVKDIREVMDKAEENLKLYNKRTILFIDEIHRFNKAQQDALLPFVERGIIILIGATTENPYFEVNKALLSRAMVLVLESLSRSDLLELINRALSDKDHGLGKNNITLTPDAIDYLITVSEGDGRVLLNSLEIGVLSTPPNDKGIIELDLDKIKESIQIKSARYDKGGEEHYDTISAFIKSMRGSDPDAAIYWLAKMINAGEDPKFIARRIIIAASEDVGNADPNALQVAISAFNAVNTVGMPEGRIPLAQAAIYVATAPKSNKSYMAINKALDDIRNHEIGRVPTHLRSTGYSGAAKLGNGKGYKYPHDYTRNYVVQDYLPEEFRGVKYYDPTENGYEKVIKERLGKLIDKDR